MNLDLLTKLVKLANNNPNENEANLAARKACKLIEEAKFKFTESNSASDQSTINQQKSTSNRGYYEQSKARWSGFDNLYEEWMKANKEDRERRTEESFRNQRNKNPFNPDNWNYTTKAGPEYYKYKPPSQQPDKRNLKCKTCGHMKSTSFVGLAEAFECNNCQWTAYQRDRSIIYKCNQCTVKFTHEPFYAGDSDKHFCSVKCVGLYDERYA